MKRLVGIFLVIIIFATWFSCPVLAGPGDGPGDTKGCYPGLRDFSNFGHPDLEKKMDGPGGTKGGPI